MEENELISFMAKIRVKVEFLLEEYNMKEFISKEYGFW